MTDREALAAEYIDACTECGRRDFPKRSDCDDCFAAAEEEIERRARASGGRFRRTLQKRKRSGSEQTAEQT